MSDKPYLTYKVTTVIKAYNPAYGDTRKCECGHMYYRHFDSYDNNRDVGCKYCDCCEFIEKKVESA